jgi:hypothetical protein
MDLATKVANFLRDQGFEPWLDAEKGIPLDSEFGVQLEEGVAGSQAVVALLTPSSVAAGSQLRATLSFAQERGIPILPIRVGDVTPPLPIISLPYIQLDSEDVGDPAKPLGELAARLRKLPTAGEEGAWKPG